MRECKHVGEVGSRQKHGLRSGRGRHFQIRISLEQSFHWRVSNSESSPTRNIYQTSKVPFDVGVIPLQLSVHRDGEIAKSEKCVAQICFSSSSNSLVRRVVPPLNGHFRDGLDIWKGNARVRRASPSCDEGQSINKQPQQHKNESPHPSRDFQRVDFTVISSFFFFGMKKNVKHTRTLSDARHPTTLRVNVFFFLKVNFTR